MWPCRRSLALGAVSTSAAIAGALALGGVALAASFDAAAPSKPDPRALTRRGMDRFRKDEVEASVEDFDAVIAAAPQMKPYMWQRGLSLYYLGRFEEGGSRSGGGGIWVQARTATCPTALHAYCTHTHRDRYT